MGSTSTGTRLVAVYKFGTPAKVTSATTNLSVNSLVTGGVGFGGGGSGGGSPAYLSRILPGIFIAYVTAN